MINFININIFIFNVFLGVCWQRWQSAHSARFSAYDHIQVHSSLCLCSVWPGICPVSHFRRIFWCFQKADGNQGSY
uniref:Secreted protein n=1 Tax=Macrostomum lignano TaxID=282301 RepID=A0A1I8IAH2_9PLAT